MTTRPRVLLVCCGLEHAHRGYESFARECYEALRPAAGIAIELVKGSGTRRPGESVVTPLRRDRAAAQAIGRVLGARPFRVEAATFALALVPLLHRRRPDVVYLSEWDTAKVLAALRRVFGLRFRLLYCNGGFADSGFEHLDHVQELTPAGRDWVLARGADPARHTVLPMGFHIAPELSPAPAAERAALRARLGLPADRQIVVSVAALNLQHKRLNYLIDELAALPPPRPFLLLDGQADAETAAVHAHARARLAPGDYDIRTSASADVPAILRASDVYVLASLAETQARALIEAAAVDTPCIAHDSPVTRFALGEHAAFGDFTRRGALTQLLAEHLQEPADARQARTIAAHRHVYERFSWDRLVPRYVELLCAVAANSTVSSSNGE